MSDHLIRVGNLRALQRHKGWTDSELARQCGRQPQQVHAWFEGDRHIGERLARRLEEALGLPRYHLDDRSTAPSMGETPPVHGITTQVVVRATNRSREIPIIRWAEVATMMDVENASLKSKAPHLDSFAPCSAVAKFLAMPDDSMSPDIRPGDHLLFDPTEAPRAGDIVLARLPNQEHFVRVFRPKSAYVFEVVAHNAHYQPLSSSADAVIVVAVLVEHRRYRQST